MQTVIVSPQDARDLLFKAAAVKELQGELSEPELRVEKCDNGAKYKSSPSKLESSAYPKELLELWEQSHYVQQGWLSAREVIQYLDL